MDKNKTKPKINTQIIKSIRHCIKTLMSIGMIAWVICAFAIAFNGVAQNNGIENTIEMIAIFTVAMMFFEGILWIIKATLDIIRK